MTKEAILITFIFLISNQCMAQKDIATITLAPYHEQVILKHTDTTKCILYYHYSGLSHDFALRWMEGYYVIEQDAFIGTYLDADKKPLPKDIVVFMSKTYPK